MRGTSILAAGVLALAAVAGACLDGLRPVVFADGFESGNHHAWRNPDPDGDLEVNDPSRGAYVAIDFTTAERARSGDYSYRFFGIASDDPIVDRYRLDFNDRISLKLTHYGPFRVDESYRMTAYYYWPSEYDLHSLPPKARDGPQNIMQWKGKGNLDGATWDPMWIVGANGSAGGPLLDDRDDFVMWDWREWNGPGDAGHGIHATKVPIPKDRWFELTVEFVPGVSDGQIRLYLDGELVWEKAGVQTIPAGYPDGGEYLWGVGNYGRSALGEDGDTPRGIYVDDVSVELLP